MKLIDNLLDQWDNDSYIDPTNLSASSLEQPKLNAKYLRILSMFRREIINIDKEMALLKDDKRLYISNLLSDEKREERGWPIRLEKAITTSTGLDKALDGDKDIVILQHKKDQYNEGIEICNAILKEISQRSFHIKNAIENSKIQLGLM